MPTSEAIVRELVRKLWVRRGRTVAVVLFCFPPDNKNDPAASDKNADVDLENVAGLFLASLNLTYLGEPEEARSSVGDGDFWNNVPITWVLPELKWGQAAS